MHNACTFDDGFQFAWTLHTRDGDRSFDDANNIILINIDDTLTRQMHIVDDAGNVCIVRERRAGDGMVACEYACIDGHVFTIVDVREARDWENERTHIDILRTRVRAFVAMHVMVNTVKEVWR